MSNSEAFKTAHKITKAVIQKGDDYKITFGESLKLVMDKSVAGIIRLGLIMADLKIEKMEEVEEWFK